MPSADSILKQEKCVTKLKIDSVCVPFLTNLENKRVAYTAQFEVLNDKYIVGIEPFPLQM